MEIALIIYILTFLFPINGLIMLGMINTHKKNRKTLIAIYKIKMRLRK